MTRLRAYVALTKPRIIELLLITTLPAMFLASQGLPRPWLVLATLIGGTASAGGANTLNCYIDRDIDARMRRTRRRPRSHRPRGAGLRLGAASRFHLHGPVWRHRGRAAAERLFHWSNAYLALLFLAVAVSPLLR
jgi:protoheme IX farnesyltransferase